MVGSRLIPFPLGCIPFRLGLLKFGHLSLLQLLKLRRGSRILPGSPLMLPGLSLPVSQLFS
jgi:hypothetical protein